MHDRRRGWRDHGTRDARFMGFPIRIGGPAPPLLVVLLFPSRSNGARAQYVAKFVAETVMPGVTLAKRVWAAGPLPSES